MEEKALLEAECDMLREQLQLLATATIGDAAEAQVHRPVPSPISDRSLQAENDTLTQEVQALKHQLAQQGADLLMTSLTAQTQHAVSKGREEDAFFESLLRFTSSSLTALTMRCTARAQRSHHHGHRAPTLTG